MVDRLETCRVYRATIPLSFLQISDLYTVPTRFYESLMRKIMCELCTFSEMWSQLAKHISIVKTESYEQLIIKFVVPPPFCCL